MLGARPSVLGADHPYSAPVSLETGSANRKATDALRR